MMRIKPGFEPDSNESQNKYSDSPGCIFLILLSIGGYFVFLAISRVTSASGSTLDQIICYGTLICVVILFALSPYFTKRERKKLQKAQQDWKNSCRSTEVSIVDRRYFPGGTWEDEYGIPHSSSPSYHLTLEVSADQKNIAPDQTRMFVVVRQPVYEQLQDRQTVRIYYQPEKPTTFLLEQELL